MLFDFSFSKRLVILLRFTTSYVQYATAVTFDVCDPSFPYILEEVSEIINFAVYVNECFNENILLSLEGGLSLNITNAPTCVTTTLSVTTTTTLTKTATR